MRLLKTFGPYLLVAALAFGAYGPILWNGAGFSHPDDSAVTHLQCCGFRPLLALTYQFNNRFGGWMAVNFGLHLAAAWLVLLLAGRVAASLFAVHPMAADAVASVSGRSALLLAVLALAAIAVFQRSRIAGFVVGCSGVAAAAGFFPSYLRTIHGAPLPWNYMKLYASDLAAQVLPKMFLPVGLNAEPVTMGGAWCARIGVLVIIIGLSVAVLAKGRVRLGIGLTILPLLPYFLIPLPNGFYEHRAYLSLAGASILAAIAVKRIPIVVPLIVLAFVAMSEVRAQVYSSPIALWEDAVSKEPQNGRARVNLGGYYARSGRWHEAIAESEAATRIAPDIAMGWQNLATLYLLRGQIGDASRVLDAYQDYSQVHHH